MQTITMYRTSQASTWESAQADGAIRTVPVYGESKSLSDGAAADALEIIKLTVDMCDSSERIAVRLLSSDGAIIDTWEQS